LSSIGLIELASKLVIQQDTRNELHDDFKQTDMAEMQMNGGINTNKESNLQES
jgi:hypothetical protein